MRKYWHWQACVGMVNDNIIEQQKTSNQLETRVLQLRDTVAGHLYIMSKIYCTVHSAQPIESF
jgi:hypothetical protein